MTVLPLACMAACETPVDTPDPQDKPLEAGFYIYADKTVIEADGKDGCLYSERSGRKHSFHR